MKFLKAREMALLHDLGLLCHQCSEHSVIIVIIGNSAARVTKEIQHVVVVVVRRGTKKKTTSELSKKTMKLWIVTALSFLKF